MTQAYSDTSFLSTIGINTGISLIGSAYQNYAQVMNALSYISVNNVRDTYDNPYTIAEFTQMASQLPLKFDFFMALGSASPEWQIAQIAANSSIVSYVEGYNESDSWWQSFHGATGVKATQAVQAFVETSVKSDPTLSGVGVIQATFIYPSSFTAYGNMSADADYASTHTYWGTGNNPIGSEASIIALAQTVTPEKPTITTESGYHTTLGNVNGVSQLVQAKYELDLLFEQAQAGVKLTYLWELVDNYADPANTNSEDHFGLFNNDWTPKLAAIALHNTMQIMADPGTGSIAPGSLNFSLGSLPSSVQTALYQRSDGTFVLVLWNDVRLSGPTVQGDIVVAPIATTLQLGQQFSHISVFDPLAGTSSIQDFTNASAVNLQVVDHPIILELSQNPAFQALHAVIAAPAQITTNPLQAVQVDGLSIASGSGTITVQLQSAVSGLSVLDTTGHLLATQSNSITLNGSLSTINAELATLTYTGGPALASDVITITSTDQSGTSSTRNVAVLVEAGTTAIDSGGPALSVPANVSIAAGTTSVLPRFTVADTYAATHAGAVTLTVQASSGTLQIPSGIGSVVGNQSSSLNLSGSFSQIVAALSVLSYTASRQSTEDNITVDIVDQAGFSSAGTTVVMVGAPVVSTVVAPVSGPAVAAPIGTAVNLDSFPPTLTVAQSVSGTTTSTTNTLSGTVSDSGSGVAAVEIFLSAAGNSTDLGQASLNGGSWSYTVNNLTPGTYSFSAVGFDKAGNTTAPISTGLAETVIAATTTRDITPPTLTVAQSVSGTTTSTSNTLSGTVSDSGSGVAAVEIFLSAAGNSTDLGQASLNGGSWSYTVNNLTLGTYSFSAVGFDKAGNTTAPISTGPAETVIAATTTRDITPPTLTVAQSVSGTTTSTTNTLSGTVSDSGSGVAAVEIFLSAAGNSTDLGQASLNGGNWSYTVNNLTLGTYSFSAVGFDKAGNTTAPISTGPAETVIAATTTRDITPPTLTVAQSVSGTTTSTTNTLSGTVSDSGSGVAAVEIFLSAAGNSTDLGQASLNGGSWSYTVNNLTPGTYSFSAVGFDKAGNTTAPISTGPAETVIAPQPRINTVAAASNTLSFQGTAGPGRTVTLSDTPAGSQTNTLATTTAGTDGSWTISTQILATSVVNTLTATSSGTSSGAFILASTGAATLSGTAGQADVFAFARIFGNDVVKNFETTAATGSTHDVIALAGTAYSSFDQLKSQITAASAAVIRFDSNMSIILSGVNANSLQASDFRFS